MIESLTEPRGLRAPDASPTSGDQAVIDAVVPTGPIGRERGKRRRAIGATESEWERWRLVAATAGCWSFLIVAFGADRLTGTSAVVVVGLYATAYLFGGTFAAISAGRDVLRRRVSVDLLMITAACGAAVVGAWAEGAVLLGLFSASNALEHVALGRTRRAVSALMDLSPPTATIIRPAAPAGEVTVAVEELTLDDIMIVRPGERIATDGVIVTGESEVDQAAVTGESLPVPKGPADAVFAGTMNGEGIMRVRVSKLPHESTLAKIVLMVEEAQAQKSRTQRFTDKFEGRYAVGVIAFSALLAILPVLILGHAWGPAFYRAMTLLVVASPCALVISTPAATLSALANAARHGILFKGAANLEDMGDVMTVAFDKTGTLTEARLRLTDVTPLTGGWTENQLLRRSASAENASEHPLARAVVAEATMRGLTLSSVSGFRGLPGRGLTARLLEAGGVTGADKEGGLVIGNERLFADLGIPIPAEAATLAERLRTSERKTVYVGDATQVRGLLAFTDTVRPNAASAVAALKGLGISRMVILTGDHRSVAEAVALQVGIDEVRADLLPDQKLEVVGELGGHGPVVMVGDGVNDAPALAMAAVGVAMGAVGTDVALETADVILMGDDLTKLAYAISLSRRTRRIIRQNLTLALAVIAVLSVSALTVGIPLPIGVVGHEGSTILVVLNGLRLLRGPAATAS